MITGRPLGRCGPRCDEKCKILRRLRMTKISSLRAPAVRNLCHRDYVEGGAAIPYGHDVCLPAFLGFGFFSFLHSHHSANQNLQADRHVTALLAVTPDLSLRTVLPLSRRATSSAFQAKRCGSLLVRPFFVPLFHLFTILQFQAGRHVATLLAVTRNAIYFAGSG